MIEATTPATSPSMISSEKITGAAVYAMTGEKLGSIESLMIDRDSGRVCYAVLEFGGFLGLGKDRYPLPWKVLRYDRAAGGYMVPLDRTALERAPSHPVDRAPDYGAGYGEQVDSFYR